jgi:hypothetical protein
MRPRHLRIPTGFSQSAQGCAAGATLGFKPQKSLSFARRPPARPAVALAKVEGRRAKESQFV